MEEPPLYFGCSRKSRGRAPRRKRRRRDGVPAASYATVAVQLIQTNPDVLMVVRTEAARAAQKATQRIPIVAIADDLIGSKFVASMPHREGNSPALPSSPSS